MEILNWIILVAGFCLIPAGVLMLCRRYRFLGKIGPVLILYALGIIIGNIGLMPGQMPAVQDDSLPYNEPFHPWPSCT